MKIVLDIILPQIVPDDVAFQVIPFDGRGALEAGIVNKLRNWNEPNVRFIVVEDQDNEDCVRRKARLAALCETAGKDALIRIVCRELESWYFGDLSAVATAYGNPSLIRNKEKKRYRNPDSIANPKEEFMKLLPAHQQLSGAQKIAPCMDVENNGSCSFNVFVSGIRELCRRR